MMTRYLDRRRFIRVPASGPARWASGARQGSCQMIDISPGGAALRMSVRRASQLGEQVTVQIELSPGVLWDLPADARVVRRSPDADGHCIVGLQFSPEKWRD